MATLSATRKLTIDYVNALRAKARVATALADALEKADAELSAVDLAHVNAITIGGKFDVHLDTPPAATRRNRGGRPKGYKTSPATRAKLRAAWKRRKAQKADAAAKREQSKRIRAEMKKKAPAPEFPFATARAKAEAKKDRDRKAGR